MKSTTQSERGDIRQSSKTQSDSIPSDTILNKTLFVSPPSSEEEELSDPTIEELAKTDSTNGSPSGWSNRIECLLSNIGLMVGFGNVWRFPYLVYKYGGGVFLIPYFLFVILMGIPTVYLESVIGQYSTMGPTGIFTNIVPLFQGLGWATITTIALISIYYNVITAWALLYLFASFRTGDLPWSRCNQMWTNDNCISIKEDKICNDTIPNGFYYQTKCHNSSKLLQERNDLYKNGTVSTAAKQFFFHYIYNYDNISHSDVHEDPLGGPQWHLSMCLLLAWILTLAFSFRGVKSFGIAIYPVSVVMVLIIIIMTIFTATLNGAADGVKFYLKPDPSKLKNLDMWGAAAVQVLFTLGPGTGIVNLATYNKFNDNAYSNALIASLVNCSISLIAGFTVFSTIGFMSHQLHQTTQTNVVQTGPELAFVVYAEAISFSPYAPVWSVLFFLMLISIGLSTMFILADTLICAIDDNLDRLRIKGRRLIIAGVVCGTLYLLGLPLCTKRGFSVFVAFQRYFSGALCIVVLVEFICVAYIYGPRNLLEIIRIMLGRPEKKMKKWFGSSGYVIKWIWMTVTPVLLGVVLIRLFVETSYQRERFKITKKIQLLAGTLYGVPLLMVITFAAVRIVLNLYRCIPLRNLFRPTARWCPKAKRELERLSGKEERKAKAPLDLKETKRIRIYRN